MMCSRCNKEYQNIMIIIADATGEKIYCPNCLAIAFQNNEISLLNNANWYDDITNKRGSVQFISNGERYSLERRAMMRLISRNLRPREWKILSAKHGSDKFMLHDDFYDENGHSLQPIL